MRTVLAAGFDRRYVLVPLLAAIALVATAFFVTEARRDYTYHLAEAVGERQDRLRQLTELVDACLVAESAQRGYLLTGEIQYLSPYDASVREARELSTHLLEHYRRDDPAEAVHMLAIRTAIEGKIREMSVTVGLMKDGYARSALSVVKSDAGLERMQEIRAGLDALRARERGRILTGITGWKSEIRINRYINAGMTGFTLLLLVAVGLLATREIHRRTAAASELEREVEARTRELQDLSAHVLRIAEREKSLLARELHDELGGLLVSMRMDLAQLKRRITLPDDESRERWQRIDAALAAGVQLKRRIIEELRPTLLDNMGLVAAIRWQAEQSCLQGGIELDAELPEAEPELPDEAAIALFRTVQESFTNILRHARARHVGVTLRVGAARLEITIEDDGVGLPEGAAQQLGSHGLRQMRFRMQAVGGTFTIANRAEGGTRTSVCYPFTRTA